MKDLINMLGSPNIDNRNQNDYSGLHSGSSNDQCQKIDTQGTGMSLCKCTSNLCNSSSKYSFSSFTISISFISVVYLFSCVFLS